MAGFFTNGNMYRVWERKGLSPDKHGRLAISENSFEQGEVLPEMELKYLGRKHKGTELDAFDGVPTFLLPDGRAVKGHKNHFDVNMGYNKSKLATRAKSETPAVEDKEVTIRRLALLQEQVAAMTALIAEQNAAEAEVPAEMPPAEEPITGDDEDDDMDLLAAAACAIEEDSDSDEDIADEDDSDSDD